MECFSAGPRCGRFARRGVAVAARRRWEELWQRASVENTEIGGKRCARARNAARAIPRIVCAPFGRWRCDWLLALCFERVVQRRQIFCKQLIELFCDVTKQFDQLLAKDLPALNDSLKAKGQQPIAPPPPKGGANDPRDGSGGVAGASAAFPADFGIFY